MNGADLSATRQLWLLVAQKLLNEGAIQVPVQTADNGAVILQQPVVLDGQRVLAEIYRISTGA